MNLKCFMTQLTQCTRCPFPLDAALVGRADPSATRFGFCLSPPISALFLFPRFLQIGGGKMTALFSFFNCHFEIIVLCASFAQTWRMNNLFYLSLPYIHIHAYSYSDFSPPFFFNLSCYLPIWFSGRLCGQHTFLYCLKNGVPLFLLNSKRITRISDVYIIVLLFVGAINASNAALKMFSHLRREHLESGRIADLLWAAALVRFSILCCFNSAEMVRKGAEKPDRVLTCGCSVSVWVSEYLVCLQTNTQKNTGCYIHWQRMG